jgi:hypothetical protein
MKDDLLERAIAAAARLHAGQVDKGGSPYILHPLRVMLGVSGPEERVLAVLHDAVEDAGWDELERELGAAVWTEAPWLRPALDAISKRPGEKWKAYLARVDANALARTVKLSDLRDNSDLSRIPHPTERDQSRTRAYARATAFLSHP